MAKKAKAVKSPPASVDGTEAETTTALVIPTIKGNAMSKDVGPAVIAALANVIADEEKGNMLLEGARTKRTDAQTSLTMAIVKLATHDNSVDLTVALGDDKKAKAHLNNQCGLALGFREVYTVGSGDKAKRTISYAKAVANYFPQPGDDKDHPDYQRKQTLRSNFLKRLAQCQVVALGIIERKMKAEVDKGTGTLRLTGPAVKDQFGATSVLLNEKQTVQDAKGKELKLTEKPSFTAIAAKTAEGHGKAGATRGTGGDRGVASAVKADPEKAIATLSNALIAAIGKVKDKLTAPMKKCLENVQNAIDAVL